MNLVALFSFSRFYASNISVNIASHAPAGYSIILMNVRLHLNKQQETQQADENKKIHDWLGWSKFQQLYSNSHYGIIGERKTLMNFLNFNHLNQNKILSSPTSDKKFKLRNNANIAMRRDQEETTMNFALSEAAADNIMHSTRSFVIK